LSGRADETETRPATSDCSAQASVTIAGGVEKFLRDDPFGDAIHLFHENAPPAVLIKLVEGLRTFGTTFGPKVRVATAFSGCDIFWNILQRLQSFYMSRFGIGFEFTHAWCCEKRKHKDHFLETQFPDIKIFTDFVRRVATATG
jgi:hypothetical protein